MKSQVKALWQLCFQDSEAFTDLYFERRYEEDKNMAIEHKGKVVAALQLLPYPMTFLNSVVSMDYISGACTHPEFRKQGLMAQLLQQALEKMLQKGDTFTTLIPAEPWLFEYYAKFGYTTVFRQSTSVYNRLTSNNRILLQDAQVEQTSQCSEEVVKWMDGIYRSQQPCSILHTAKDLQMVSAALQLDGGHIYLLRRNAELQAIAFATPRETNNWQIDELLATNGTAAKHVLQHICDTHQQKQLSVLVPTHFADESVVRSPLGMARIVKADKALQLYAKAYPKQEMYIHLQDAQLPGNRGYYTVKNGICTRSEQPINTAYKTVTIGELTGQLLTPLHPYMSLMLN